LTRLLREIRACRICEADLPFGADRFYAWPVLLGC